MAVAYAKNAESGGASGLERASRREFPCDRGDDRSWRSGALCRAQAKISEVLVVSGADAFQQLFDDHVFSDPGELLQVELGLSDRDSDLRGPGMGGVWTFATGAGGDAFG